ncbi:MAG: Ig-like domain repeat protein [Sulfobacillus sp.]
MKVKMLCRLFIPELNLTTLITATAARKGSAPPRCGLSRAKAALLILLALFAWSRSSVAQGAGQIGLPVIFVHGICDTADSFLPVERAVRATLESHYPTQYPPPALSSDPEEHVVFYDGVSVNFQVPPASQYNPVLNIDQVDKTRRFFLVALDDPGQTEYQFFDAANAVANIPIYQKGNELAHIIWKIKDITGAPRVIVVGHSMGGLDARAYIEGLASPNGTTDQPIPYFNDISALVTLDTPHGGSLLAGLSASVFSGALGACASNDSVDKSEMFPQGLDPITQTESIIPQLNYYQSLSDPYTFAPQPFPAALTVTSIASYWYDPGALFPRLDEGTDDVLTSLTQDVATNLANPKMDSNSALVSNNNTFITNFPEYGNAAQSCGTTSTPLHFLTCTGSVPQTFSLIEDAIFSMSIVTSGNVQITPATSTVAPNTTAPYTASTGSSTVWSILEGQDGGSITPTIGTTVTYQAPANYTHSTETFHVIAFNGQYPTQYAEVPVQVTSSFSTTATTTVLSLSANQVQIGANLTINATIQGSGGTPTGTVSFYDGGKTLGPEIVNNAGVATYSTTSLPLGFHSITAQYSGDSNYTASTSSAVTIAVIAIDPQLSVSPTSGTLGVTSFTKADTGFTPYGLITNTATLPGGGLSVLQTYAKGDGTYSYNRTYLTAGTYSQIDTDGKSGQTTTPVTWTVSAPIMNDFSLSVSPSSQSVSQGSSVSYNVVTATSSGTGQNIALSASNVPSGITASFSPATVESGTQTALTVTASSSAPTGTYTLTLLSKTAFLSQARG